jgi:hypothetical protein
VRDVRSLDAAQLPIGSLAVVCAVAGLARPGLVSAWGDDSFRLHLAADMPVAPGDRVVVAWSVDGEPRELRTRVVRRASASREVEVAREGELVHEDVDRRALVRFPLAAEAILASEDDTTVAGRVIDVSMLGAAVLLEPPLPKLGTRGSLSLRADGKDLLPWAPVRVMHADVAGGGLLARVGVEFADPARAVPATSSLLRLLVPGGQSH